MAFAVLYGLYGVAYNPPMAEIVGAAVGESVSRDAEGVLTKLLGPTAEVMGDQIKGWYVRRFNVGRVVDRASSRANTDDEGAIPPRVVDEVLSKAQWAENEFLAEYLSGVLASGRTSDGEDDSSIPWSSLVGRMSSDQLALHWVVYSGFQGVIEDVESVDFWAHARSQLAVDVVHLLSVLGWPIGQGGINRLYEAAYALQREGLLTQISHGQGKYLRDEVTWTRGRDFLEGMPYITFAPTQHGVGLFLRAIGFAHEWFDEIFSGKARMAVKETPNLPVGLRLLVVKDMPLVEPQSRPAPELGAEGGATG